MPRIRVHQHVNPLAPYFRHAPEPLEIRELFPDPSLPIHLDIGSARGNFLMEMAQIDKQRNFIGVEIREPLVIEGNQIKEGLGLENLYFKFCNASIWLDKLIEKIPDGLIDIITIQFPDPWYKKRHAKRRMVKDKLAACIAKRLRPGGKLFIQSDVGFLAEEMFALFRESGAFDEQSIDKNPFPVKTEREKAVEAKQLPIYRRIFIKLTS